jgi:hypothetical protein
MPTPTRHRTSHTECTPIAWLERRVPMKLRSPAAVIGVAEDASPETREFWETRCAEIVEGRRVAAF